VLSAVVELLVLLFIFLQRVTIERPQRSHVTTSATEIKKVLVAKSFTTLASSNMLENIHEAKSLQPITPFDEG